jgi:hypothetical protein
MSDVFDVLIRALETATDEQLDALIRYLQTYHQRRRDAALMREIAWDARRAPNPSPAPTVRVEGAGAVVSGDDGAAHGGWRDAPRLDDWRPPGERAFNALMDAQDRIDRAKRGQG